MIDVIQYTIYFTFEYIIFKSYHLSFSKGEIKIKRNRRESQASKYRSSRGFVDHSYGGVSTFVSCPFYKITKSKQHCIQPVYFVN